MYTVTPVGTVRKCGTKNRIEIDARYRRSLRGLGEFSHVWVLCWLDQNDTPSKRQRLTVHPRGDPRNPRIGVFATRSPARPNPISLTLCKIEAVTHDTIVVRKIDVSDGTPVIDLKPYIERCDRGARAKAPSWTTDRARRSVTV